MPVVTVATSDECGEPCDATEPGSHGFTNGKSNGAARRSPPFVHSNSSKNDEAGLIRNAHSNLLFVGNAMEARDLRLLHDTGIQAVVDLAINELPAQLGREFIYCRFPINDGDGNPDWLLAIAVRTVCSLIGNNTSTLVACSAGMSRAPAIAAASISRLTNANPDQCLGDIITNAPNDVSPILWTHIKRVYNG